LFEHGQSFKAKALADGASARAISFLAEAGHGTVSRNDIFAAEVVVEIFEDIKFHFSPGVIAFGGIAGVAAFFECGLFDANEFVFEREIQEELVDGTPLHLGIEPPCFFIEAFCDKVSAGVDVNKFKEFGSYES